MSDGFSWVPFGPSLDDDDLPPLAPLGDEEEEVSGPPPPPLPESEPPPLVVTEAELEPLIIPAPPPPPADEPGWREAPAIVAERRPRVPIKIGGDPAAAFIWGIVGLSICPLLIPSIAAIKVGNRARAASGGRSGLASAGIVMGWIGVVIWTLVILVVINA